MGATTNICEKYVKNEGEETEEIEKIEGVIKLETSDNKEITDFSMVLEREVKVECIALAESNTGMLSGKTKTFFRCNFLNHLTQQSLKFGFAHRLLSLLLLYFSFHFIFTEQTYKSIRRLNSCIRLQ